MSMRDPVPTLYPIIACVNASTLHSLRIGVHHSMKLLRRLVNKMPALRYQPVGFGEQGTPRDLFSFGSKAQPLSANTSLRKGLLDAGLPVRLRT